MERRRFANTDLSVSIIGLGCYGMSGAYGPADDVESISTIHRALDLGVNFLAHRPAMAKATIIA
jgi:aryl-alcohol dehydrogenase-like predicted oxidoreductase